MRNEYMTDDELFNDLYIMVGGINEDHIRMNLELLQNRMRALREIEKKYNALLLMHDNCF